MKRPDMSASGLPWPTARPVRPHPQGCRLHRVWLAGALALALAAPALAQPRVRLIATGGTIANARDGRWSAETLLSTVAGLADIARVEPETFSRTASLALSLDDWLRLARRVNEVATEPDLAGIVVTVGTDTLEELAWFLDLTVRGQVPIVVTGAIRKPGGPQSDGPANLLEAVRVAASPAARGHGTLVVFHGLIFPARDVVKTSTLSADAFGGSSGTPVGRVNGADVRLDDPDARRHGARSEFDVNRISQLARVDVLLTYQQAPGDLVTSAVRNGARGLVMAAAGAGALSASELEAVAAALRGRAGGAGIAGRGWARHVRGHGPRTRPDLGRRSCAAQGAHPADARAFARSRRAGASEGVQGVLNGNTERGRDTFHFLQRSLGTVPRVLRGGQSPCSRK